MNHLIKNIAFILLVCCFTAGTAQNKALDSLIQKIDNRDAYLVLTKTTSPRVKGDTAKRIVAMGKSASGELVKVLDSQTQGIVAHFILSEIYKDHWEEELCCQIYNDGTAEIVTINGLEIRITDNVLYSTTENLKKNQLVWKKNCKV